MSQMLAGPLLVVRCQTGDLTFLNAVSSHRAEGEWEGGREGETETETERNFMLYGIAGRSNRQIHMKFGPWLPIQQMLSLWLTPLY